MTYINGFILNIAGTDIPIQNIIILRVEPNNFKVLVMIKINQLLMYLLKPMFTGL